MIGIIRLGKLGLAIASIIASRTPPGTVLGMAATRDLSPHSARALG